jgi:hypothetical protein
MKVALLISGEMRTHQECFSNLSKTIIKKYNPDIFIHTWKKKGLSIKDARAHHDESYTSIYNEIASIEQSFYESYFDTILNIQRPQELKEREPLNSRGNLPLFYKMEQCFELMEKHEKENDFLYDYVIRMRPDLEVFGNLPNLKELSPKCIYLSHSKISASDQFAIGSRAPLKYYCSVFSHLKEYWKDPIRTGEYKDTLVGERLMKYHLDKNKDITMNTIDADLIIRRFDDSLINKRLTRIKRHVKRKAKPIIFYLRRFVEF